MGILPLQFKEGVNASTLKLTGAETFDLLGLEENLKPKQEADLVIHKPDGSVNTIRVIVRIDTPIEIDYYRHGGILPYVLRQLAK
jgi:aconitate hydratase